jgi:hypothetical protein
MLVCAAALALGACGWFGADAPAPAPAEQAATAEGAEPPSVLPGGVLRNIATAAPPQTPAQYLALLADQFGWEPAVAQNEILAKAVESGDMEGQVEPFLLGLFYRNGFAVLPQVGEGHEFSRDSVVRGPLGSARYLVTTRKPVRIILLAPTQNAEIVYPQDGEQPQVFSLEKESSVTVRTSRTEHYLR